MSFPISLDSFVTLVDNTDDVMASHQNERATAIVAIETKLGINSSAVTTSIDYFLKHSSGAYRSHIHDGSSDDGANVPLANTTGTLPVNRGGTGSTTQNFIDLTTTQSISGEKDFDNLLSKGNIVEGLGFHSADDGSGDTWDTDASLGKQFSFTATANFTLNNPTGLTYDGQVLIYRIKQDSVGSRVISFSTMFRGVSNIILTTTAYAIDYLGFVYNQTDNKLDCVAFAGGIV
jgi:hypothetical protein